MKKNYKYLFLFIFLLSTMNIFASDNISRMKENYKYDFISFRAPKNTKIIRFGDRVEADALLELATEGYIYYEDYFNKTIKTLTPCSEIILFMPRIDLLEKHWNNLAKKTEKMFVFIMKGDKLEGNYGDRSYETYLAKGLDKKLPKNIKVFFLEDESVTSKGLRNNFEITNILDSQVYRNQISRIYREETGKNLKLR